MKLLLAFAPWLVLAFSEAPPAERYQIIFLRPDPARKPLSKEDGERIQSAHMANIHALADRGVLVAAGPFDDKPHTISGVFFFKTASSDEALREAVKDPTVVEHRNTVDVLAWRGPKGLGEEYKRLHKGRSADARSDGRASVLPAQPDGIVEGRRACVERS